MIAMSPMDAALDTIAANLVGDFIDLLYGDLNGFLVLATVWVFGVIFLQVAKGERLVPAVERGVWMMLVLGLLGIKWETSVKIWMTGGEGSDTSISQTMDIGAGGETSVWLPLLSSIPDAFVFPMIDVISGDDEGVDSLYVYTLTAFEQVTAYKIADPKLRQDLVTFIGECAPLAFEEQGAEGFEADGAYITFLDWVKTRGRTKSITTGPSDVLKLLVSGEQTYVNCGDMYDSVLQTYKEDLINQKAAEFEGAEGFFEEMMALSESMYDTDLVELSLAGKIGKMMYQSVQRSNGRFASPTGSSGPQFWNMQFPGRGEVIADSAVGVAGFFDRLLDGGLSTKLMAIVMPAFLALARFAVMILFPFAFLSLGFTDRKEPFIYWFLALVYVKLQYLIMVLFLRLEMVMGEILAEKLQPGLLSLEAVPQISTFHSILSILFAGGTVTAAAITASIFKLGPGVSSAVGRMTGQGVRQSAGAAIALGGLAIRGATGGLRGALRGKGGSGSGGDSELKRPDPEKAANRSIAEAAYNAQSGNASPMGGGASAVAAQAVAASKGRTEDATGQAVAAPLPRPPPQLHAMPHRSAA